MSDLDPADDAPLLTHEWLMKAQFMRNGVRDWEAEAKWLRKRLEERIALCAEVYQAVGVMGEALGHWDDGHFIPCIDNLMDRLNDGAGYGKVPPALKDIFDLMRSDNNE